MNKKILIALRIVITFAIIFALLKIVPYAQIKATFSDSSNQKGFIYLALLIFTISMACCTLRWKIILNALGVRASFRQTIAAFFSGLFFNLFFPSFIAGDILRGFMIGKRHGQLGKSASSVLMDRVSGMIAISVLALATSLFSRELRTKTTVMMPVFLLAGLVAIACTTIFSRRFFMLFVKLFNKKPAIKNHLISFHDKLYLFKKRPLIFFYSFVLSLAIQVLISLSYYSCFMAFKVQVGITDCLILVPIIMAIASLPLTVAGIGTREAATVYFFSLIAISKDVSLSVSLLNLAFMVAMSISGGFIYLFIQHRLRPPPDMPTEKL